jgi:D-alanyl-lipoteichoic acid acyltransferase DltB (MBOAT superfamily)
MLFNSLNFLLFFPIVVVVYFSLNHRFRNIFLLVASYYFYMNWKPVYAVLIMFSTFITWLCGLFIEKSNKKKARKIYLVISLLINFSILFFYKYFNFLNQVIYDSLNYMGLRYEMVNLDILLPVGISFYTFQAIGYTIDIYRKDIKHETNFINYSLFVSFFPQLVAGPIERAKNLLPQFREFKVLKKENLYDGLKLMLWGYFLKLVLADRLGLYVDAIFNNIENHNGTSISLASILFAFQIYGDFSGYSLIAIGAAKVMGFELMTNFMCPYFSLSITTFWRRWHISLSTWFKDYLYIPLGGNRCSGLRNNFNLFITFFVSGIWHGANYTFVIWGSLHGLYLIIEKKLKINHTADKIFIKIFKILFTFLLVDFAWIFFRSNTMNDALLAIQEIFTTTGESLFLKADVLIGSFLAIIILLSKEFKDEFMDNKIRLISNKNPYISSFFVVLLFSIVLLLGVFDSGQFIYFQF